MEDLRREKEELRQKRGQLDRDILALLVRRAKLSRGWAQLAQGEAAKLPSSERDTIEELVAAAGDELPAEGVRAIFREVHAVCRALEAPVRVAFVGVEGGLGHVAARRQFGALARYTAHESVSEALGAVEIRQADFAVLPYESGAEGAVPATLLGLRQTELRLVALLEVDTTLQLLSRAASAEAIAKVYATARDRAEARGLLSSLVPHAVVFDVATPLEACQRAAADPASGALGLEATGQLHELGVLGATSATPGHESHIRFCVASARPSSRTGKDATSLLFTVSDEPGALFEVLKHFAERGVNLRKIQSRPAEEDGLGYLFFVEVSGHLTDRNVVTALEGLKKQTKTLKILGSYPL